jgi:spore coat protein U-like protein
MKKILALLLVLVPAVLFAGTATQNLNVTATIPSKCIITSVSDISFGTYDPVDQNSSNPLDADGSVQFRCVKRTTYWVYITGTRQMQGPQQGDVLNFELYSDSQRTQIFPDQKTGSGEQAGNFNAITKTIYGRVPANQDAAFGDYSRTLTVTVEW